MQVEAFSELMLAVLARARELRREADELAEAVRHFAAESKDRGEGNAQPSEGVRLLITQMATEGASREVIAARLREEFGLVEIDAVLPEAPAGD